MSFFRVLKRLYQLLYRKDEHLINSHDLITQHIASFTNNFPKHQEALYYSKEMLEDFRNKKLRALLLHAKLNSPWYKKTLAKINIEKFTQERLAELPTINKNILMENWDAIVTNPKLSLALVEQHLSKKNEHIDSLYMFSKYHVISTGGSSGKRGIFIFDSEEWATFFASFIRYPLYNQERTRIVTNSLSANSRSVYLGINNTATIAYAFAKNFSLHNDHQYYLPMATTPLNIVITRLNQIQPDILSAPPSYIHKVCQLVQKRQVNIDPKIIFVCAEPLFELTEALIKKTWPNVNIFNIFGCSEGLTGINCGANRNEMHLNDDQCIVEPLNEQSLPVEKGTMASKIYLTNLYNYTLPLIRYENADHILFLNKTCECGIHHQLITTPKDRPGYDFNFPGNIFVHHSLFLAPLLLEKNIQEYQVLQTIDGFDIKILATGFIDKRKLQDNIRLRLSKVGLFDAPVNIIEVPEFVYLHSGKLSRFIPLNLNSGN